jgi:hypothetical protein
MLACRRTSDSRILGICIRLRDGLASGFRPSERCYAGQTNPARMMSELNRSGSRRALQKPRRHHGPRLVGCSSLFFECEGTVLRGFRSGDESIRDTAGSTDSWATLGAVDTPDVKAEGLVVSAVPTCGGATRRRATGLASETGVQVCVWEFGGVLRNRECRSTGVILSSNPRTIVGTLNRTRCIKALRRANRYRDSTWRVD